MKKDIFIVSAVFIGVLLFGVYLFTAQPAEEIAYKPVDVGGGSITVENQPDTSRVVLDATLAAPGWITVHESLSGAPATVVGTSRFLPVGEYVDLEILPTEELVAGARYITLLHVDNGDERFEILEDLPVMTDGQVVRPDFVAGREPGDDSTIIDIPGTDESIEVDPTE